MAAAYYPAPSLVVLRDEADREHPGRDKRSDGWIGDTSHKTSGMPENGGSKHNPNRRGCVCARDFDSTDLDVARFVAAAIAHPSTRNVIYNRKIRSKGYSGGLSRAYAYHGANGHTQHVHVDVEMTERQENDTRPWGYYRGGSKPPVVTVPVVHKPGTPAAKKVKGGMTRMPVLRRNASRALASVRTLQRALTRAGFSTRGVDGRFGPNTYSAVRAFQKRYGLGVDGVVGPKTWAALAQALVTKAGYTSRGVDGKFGPNTAAAVAKFQKARKITADGIVGPVTWAYLVK